MMKEFKEFITRGSVLDLAIGIIIGGAIGKIVASLVNDILMPLVGLLLGGINFAELKATIGSASINYGLFIQSIVDFIIIALCIFLIIKFINKFKKEKEQAPAEPAKVEVLLEEIRDLLKKNNS